MKRLIPLLFITPAYAGGYLDLGITFLDRVEIRETVVLESPFGNSTLTETALVPVETSVPMIRLGYELDGLHVELEAIGESELTLQKGSVFYRWEF